MTGQVVSEKSNKSTPKVIFILLMRHFYKIALFASDKICLSPRGAHGVNIRLKSHIFLIFIFFPLRPLQDITHVMIFHVDSDIPR